VQVFAAPIEGILKDLLRLRDAADKFCKFRVFASGG
jgi:hypothetical protein